MLGILMSADFWKLALPLFSAVLAWYINERQKRLWDQYERKESSYKELLRTLRGFYVGAPDAEKLKLDFLDQLNRCWLYCPDDVILKGYTFLESVLQRQTVSDAVKQKAMGDFVAAIRIDLFSGKLVRDTDLTGDSFRHYTIASGQ